MNVERRKPDSRALVLCANPDCGAMRSKAISVCWLCGCAATLPVEATQVDRGKVWYVQTFRVQSTGLTASA